MEGILAGCDVALSEGIGIQRTSDKPTTSDLAIPVTINSIPENEIRCCVVIGFDTAMGFRHDWPKLMAAAFGTIGHTLSRRFSDTIRSTQTRESEIVPTTCQKR